MGSPLGPLMANYYMCHLENTIFEDNNLKPKLYCRYMDDIFVVVEKFEQLENLRLTFTNNSVLNFTFETECKK